MKRQFKRLHLHFVVVCALLAVMAVAAGWRRPAEAQTYPYPHGRFVFIDKSNPQAGNPDHYIIFDTETGQLNEWIGKKDSVVWTYKFGERDLVRRSAPIR